MLRVDEGLTQKELASIIGVSQAAISQFEKAQSRPCQSVEILLMDFFGLDFDTDGIEYKNSRPINKRKRKTNMIDDRVCMHYVVDRLEGCLDERYDDKIRKAIEDFKEECIYNLGVNTRIKRKGED
tara:strand:- start:5 stop:382 length:378 start_codon:yes stop_codon:yes gene_type:complete